MKKEKKIYLWCIIVVTVLSVLPLMMLSVYDHPSADDYSYAIKTYHDWKENGSILSVIKTAVETSAEYWYTWQGLYTSAFLLALQPGIFGEGFYGITGILMISVIFVGNILFSIYMLHNVLKGSKLAGAAVGCTLSFLMIQWMPSFVEGLYWYNGAVNYVFFFSLLEILICITVSVGRTNQLKSKVLRIIGGCVTGFIMAGGNHVTAFIGILYLCLLCILSFALNRAREYRWNVPVLLVMVAGFIFNVTSPGTAKRQSKFENGYTAFQSVKASLLTGLDYINSWIGIALIVCIVILLPVIYDIVKKFREDSGYRFSYPLLVLVFSIGGVCAMFCPPLYAMGNFGAGRLLNVVYFTFVLLTFINVFYLCGWVQEKIVPIDRNREDMELSKGWICAACCLFVGLVLTSGNEAGVFYSVGLLTDGQAKIYSDEAYERVAILENSMGEDVVVSSYSVWPPLLFFDDITDKKKDWRNKAVRDYYDLSSIKLK
ncbi:MAG: DUF6056 family protein [Roseburia sp.]|nr:DUF6056 family protein [Roseburia sp.]